MQHTTTFGLAKYDYGDVFDVFAGYNPDLDTLDAQVTIAQQIGGQVVSAVTAPVSAGADGVTWSLITGLGFVLPNTTKTYEVSLWGPSYQTSALGLVRVGVGVPGPIVLVSYMRSTPAVTNTPYGPVYARASVVGLGQTIAVYVSSSVPGTVTLDAFVDSPLQLTYQRTGA